MKMKINPEHSDLLTLERKLIQIRNLLFVNPSPNNESVRLLRETIDEIHIFRQQFPRWIPK